MLELPASPLVSSAWLAEHLGHPQLRVVDMRGTVLPPTAPKPHYFGRREDYLASHIPGAVYLDWTTDLVDLDDPALVQVAPSAKIAQVLGSLGIGDDTVVLAYDPDDHTYVDPGALHARFAAAGVDLSSLDQREVVA
ncbi:rhodanese-like domain-containing protein [Candidatus Chloroploca sp. Khr17]|uniref:rhodanese-like domain-containing protein n=1 Tax=Candidatus Chloroploca sp. Khr17 TaxID=2496869 RepID=UPI001F117535|nr:rhodanese-like domain-containing protein [Candidatus Chloroploca sp. Khr17]